MSTAEGIVPVLSQLAVQQLGIRHREQAFMPRPVISDAGNH
jgi:hypothetical protein